MRNIERFPSKQMYPYLSLVQRKVAEFYHNIDRRRCLVWVKMTYFHCFFQTKPDQAFPGHVLSPTAPNFGYDFVLIVPFFGTTCMYKRIFYQDKSRGSNHLVKNGQNQPKSTKIMMRRFTLSATKYSVSTLRPTSAHDKDTATSLKIFSKRLNQKNKPYCTPVFRR